MSGSRALRRRLSLAVAAALAVGGLGAAQWSMTSSALSARIYYVTPDGAGAKDGSSWSNAGTLPAISSFVSSAPAGAQIWVRGDLGAYRQDGSIKLAGGGTVDAPVVIRGVDATGAMNARPSIVGSRTAPWTMGSASGKSVFNLAEGAKNLKFVNLGFKNQGNGAFRISGNVSNIAIENMRATNVQRFLENSAGGTSTTATASGLTVRNVEVRGYSKQAIRLRYDTNNVLVEDFLGDSEKQDGDDFAMGVHLDGTAHDLVFRRVTMRNNIQTVSFGVKLTDSKYWNGDGFVAEDNVHNLLFEDTVAEGNTDGGYDLKSKTTTLRRTVARDNKRNYRFWFGGKTAENCLAENPRNRGGTGGADQVWVKGAHTGRATSTVTGCILRDSSTSARSTAFGVEGTGGKVAVKNTMVTFAGTSRLDSFQDGATATYTNVSVNGSIRNSTGQPIPATWSTQPTTQSTPEPTSTVSDPVQPSPQPTATVQPSPQPTATVQPTVGGLPDLRITSLTWNSASPRAGTPLTFSATVTNVGTAPTPAGIVNAVRFEIDGATVTWNTTFRESLAPGATTVISASAGSAGPAWTATSGDHKLQAKIDYKNNIDEVYESNNTRTLTLRVA